VDNDERAKRGVQPHKEEKNHQQKKGEQIEIERIFGGVGEASPIELDSREGRAHTCDPQQDPAPEKNKDLGIAVSGGHEEGKGGYPYDQRYVGENAGYQARIMQKNNRVLKTLPKKKRARLIKQALGSTHLERM